MPDFLYGARLPGIMADVFIKPCTRLSIDEYNYRESLQARAIEGIGHYSWSLVVIRGHSCVLLDTILLALILGGVIVHNLNILAEKKHRLSSRYGAI